MRHRPQGTLFFSMGAWAGSVVKRYSVQEVRERSISRSSFFIHPSSPDEDGSLLLPEKFQNQCNAIPGSQCNVSYHVIVDFRHPWTCKVIKLNLNLSPLLRAPPNEMTPKTRYLSTPVLFTKEVKILFNLNCTFKK
ncbi:hypothetical protein NPIL_586611 [Nephila pilipes]|uniref:Uncharacterized protein n=1 Tax=Nephila pilipes TaxID=299642 RepID=A0A8X6I5Y9_NEPPI|nr:hypothetical protein NPIL_586611 [Nephila pilipes]